MLGVLVCCLGLLAALKEQRLYQPPVLGFVAEIEAAVMEVPRSEQDQPVVCEWHFVYEFPLAVIAAVDVNLLAHLLVGDTPGFFLGLVEWQAIDVVLFVPVKRRTDPPLRYVIR